MDSLDKAIKDFEKATALKEVQVKGYTFWMGSPDFYYAYLTLGDYYNTEDSVNLDKALEYYSLAIGQDKRYHLSNTEAYLKLAKLRIRLQINNYCDPLLIAVQRGDTEARSLAGQYCH